MIGRDGSRYQVHSGCRSVRKWAPCANGVDYVKATLVPLRIRLELVDTADALARIRAILRAAVPPLLHSIDIYLHLESSMYCVQGFAMRKDVDACCQRIRDHIAGLVDVRLVNVTEG
jgi:hypothetical protein